MPPLTLLLHLLVPIHRGSAWVVVRALILEGLFWVLHFGISRGDWRERNGLNGVLETETGGMQEVSLLPFRPRV